MHYYLGLEVWQKPNEIYPGQGNCVIKMLQRFGIMDRKPLKIPMITNLKRLRSSKSSPVDPTIYRKWVGSLMYLVNTRPYICFAVNIPNEFQMEHSPYQWIATKHILIYS